MRSHRVLSAVAAALVLLTAGCSGDDTSEAGSAQEAPVEEAPDADDDADAGAQDAPADDSSDTTAAAGPVDVCALFTADDFTAVFGVAADAPGAPVEPQGSLLGGCSYMGPDGQAAMIQARPATEWEGTVEMYGGAPAAGASMDTTFEASIGLLAAFDGQPWFAHIMSSLEPGSWDEATSVAVAEAIAAKL